jgi:hypothetical protein
MYYFPRVRTRYILVCTVFTSSGCCFMWYACGKQYSACMTCMRWCSNTESVPLLVSIIHDIILVRTQYVLVCTGLHYYTFPVPVCTEYVPVRTNSEQVRTKYPIPVMQFTIPDGPNPYQNPASGTLPVGHCDITCDIICDIGHEW